MGTPKAETAAVDLSGLQPLHVAMSQAHLRLAKFLKTGVTNVAGKPSAVGAAEEGAAVAVEFVNEAATPVFLFWQDPSTGQEVFQREIQGRSKSRVNSFAGHTFTARDRRDLKSATQLAPAFVVGSPSTKAADGHRRQEFRVRWSGGAKLTAEL